MKGKIIGWTLVAIMAVVFIQFIASGIGDGYK